MKILKTELHAYGFIKDGGTSEEILMADGSTTILPVIQTSVTIPANDVKSSNTTPVEIIPAAGADTLIDLLSVIVKIDYNSEAYDEPNAYVGTHYFTNMTSAFDILLKGRSNDAVANQVFSNTPIHFSLLSDSVTGDSPVTVYAAYRIIDIS